MPERGADAPGLGKALVRSDWSMRGAWRSGLGIQLTGTESADMGNTWQKLLDDFAAVLNGDYRNAADREEALIEETAFTMLRILEKLRDEHGEL